MEVKTSYDEYVESYAKCYGITPAEAKEHAIVKVVKKHYEETE